MNVRLVPVLLLPSLLCAQDSRFAHKRVPFEPGFRVYYIADMEGGLELRIRTAD